MEALKDILKAKPIITHVYFNEKGGYVFSESKLHPIVKTRDEILAESETVAEVKAEPKGKRK